MRQIKTKIVFYLMICFLIGVTGIAFATEKSTFNLDKAVKDEDKGIIQLNADDPTYNLWNEPRDRSKDPKREPGPINLHRNKWGNPFVGIRTFFHRPVAIYPEDLKAGNVDVAFLGMGYDFNSVRRGALLGPQAVRSAEVLLHWKADGTASSEHTDTMIDPFHVLNVVDYGDAPIEFLSLERTMAAGIPLVRDAAKTGAALMIAGGSHSVPYPAIRGIVEANGGKGSVQVIHFDSHNDAQPYGMGHAAHYGTFIRSIIDDDLVAGKHITQVGLRGPVNSIKALKWQREAGINLYHMAEIRKNGWDKAADEILAILKKGPEKVYVSVDLDFYDASVAVGTTAPSHGGPMPVDFFPLLRAICIQNECVAVDIVEVQPGLDDASGSTMRLASQTLYESMVGIALKKQGITDPWYVHPDVLNK